MMITDPYDDDCFHYGQCNRYKGPMMITNLYDDSFHGHRITGTKLRWAGFIYLFINLMEKIKNIFLNVNVNCSFKK